MFDFQKSSIKLGKIFSIGIEINYTWIFIFLLVSFTFSFSLYPTLFPLFSQTTNIILGFLTAILLFFSIIAHELAHSLVAKKQGIEVKKITLFIFGGVAQISNEPKDPRSELKMAIAGPLLSFFLAGLFWMIYIIARNSLPASFVAPLPILSQINLVIAVFNLAPGFPLDGGRVLRSVLWLSTKNLVLSTKIAVYSGRFLAYLLISLGFFQALFGNLSGIWLVILGFFLEQAAVSNLIEMETHEALSKVQVKNIMNDHPVIIQDSLTIEEFTQNQFQKEDTHNALVEDKTGKIIGFLDLDSIKNPETVATKEAKELIFPYQEEDYLKKEDSAEIALNKMEKKNESILPVMENEEIIGSISKENLINYLRLRKA